MCACMMLSAISSIFCTACANLHTLGRFYSEKIHQNTFKMLYNIHFFMNVYANVLTKKDMVRFAQIETFYNFATTVTGSETFPLQMF